MRKTSLLWSLAMGIVSLGSVMGMQTGCGDDGNVVPAQPSDGGLTNDVQQPSNDGGTDPETNIPNGGFLPNGYRNVVPWPAKGQPQHLSMVLDENSDPLLSYMIDGIDQQPSEVYFTRWDRTKGAFTTPVMIDTAGLVETNQPFRETSIAIDPLTKAIGVAYQKGVSPNPPGTALPRAGIMLAQSTDNGLTWTNKEQISVHTDQTNSDSASDPTLEMRNGVVHIAYVQELQLGTTGPTRNGWYVTRPSAGAPFVRTAFQRGGAPQTRIMPVDMALDANGQPAIIYFTAGPGTYETGLYFERPGQPAVKVVDTQIQNDNVSASLAFDGTKPYVVTHLKSVADAPYDMQLVTSTDGMAAWSATPIPLRSTHRTDNYQSISITNDHAINIVARFTSAAAGGTGCGGPVMIAATGQTAPTTFCQDTTIAGFAGLDINVRHGTDGRMVMSMIYANATDTTLPRGVVVWKQPPPQ
jgi:hypothetical protein